MNISRREWLKWAAVSGVPLLGVSCSDKNSSDSAKNSQLSHAALASAPTDEWGFTHAATVGQTQIINAVEVRLSDFIKEQPSSLNLVVYAYRIIIDSRFELPGANVLLHAFEIECVGDNATIATNGPPPDESYDVTLPAQALPGANFGDSGKPGKAGSAGKNAGNISVFAEKLSGKLVFEANGGKGGQGQKGGDGRQGSRGNTGPDADQSSAGYHKGGTGYTGSKSGDAGPGGDGGAGGDAGKLTIRTIDHNPNILVLAIPGSGGKGGEYGKPGEKSEGGFGGQSYICKHSHVPGPEGGDDGPLVCKPSGTGDIGAFGPPGTRPPPPSQPGKPGNSEYAFYDSTGTLSTPNYAGIYKLINYGDLGDRASFIQLQMLFHKASLEYLNGRYADCISKFSWIERVTRTAYGKNIPLKGEFGCPSQDFIPPDVSEWKAMHDNAAGLLKQIAYGLDYFGHPKSYAPVLSYTYYKDMTKQMFDIADSIEESCSKYRTAAKDNQFAENDLKSVRDQTAATINTLQSEAGKLETARKALKAQIDQLFARILQQQDDLKKIEVELKQAIEQKNKELNGGCDFGQTLIVLVSVAALANSAYLAAAGIVNELISLGDTKLVSDLDHLKDSAELLMKKARIIESDISTIGKSFDELKALLGSHYDEGKLILKEEDFEKTLAPYMDLGPAKKYRDQMRAYLDTVKSRNNKIIEHDAAYLREVNISQEIKRLTHEIKRVNALLQTAAGDQQNIAEFRVFIEGAYMKAKKDIIRALYSKKKAYEYWSLTTKNLQLNDQNIASLKASDLEFITDEEQVKASRLGSAKETQNVKVFLSEKPSDDPKIQWRELVLPTAFRQFQKSGRLSFAIPFPKRGDIEVVTDNFGSDNYIWTDNSDENTGSENSASKNSDRLPFTAFEDLPGITLSKVSIQVPNVDTTTKFLRVHLKHHGLSSFISPDRSVTESLTYSHAFRPFSFQFDLESSETLPSDASGPVDNEYILLSPFASWDLFINKAENPGLDLSAVTQIILIFNYFHLEYTS